MEPDNNINITIIEEINEIEKIRSVWEKYQWYPYSEIDYYINVISHHRNFIRPYIIVGYINEKPVGLIISRIINDDYKVKIGYKVLFSIPFKNLEILYGGILGDISEEIQVLIIDKIKKDLRGRKYDIAKFDYLDIRNKLLNRFSTINTKFTRKVTRIVNPHWKLQIPGSFEEFMDERTTTTRRNIRGSIKKLEKKLKGSYEIRSFTRLSEFETIMKDTDEVASQTYQRALNVGVENDKETRREYLYLLENGRLYVSILYIDNRPAAYSTGIIYNKYFVGSKMGYDPKYRSCNVGTYLLINMIKEFCESQKIKIMDFGFGHAEYKKSYGSEVFEESSITLYAPGLRGIYLEVIMNFSKIFLIAPKRFLKKLVLFKYLKKKWREKLSQKVDKFEKATI